MIIRVGLLSSNHEVIESVKASCTDFEFVKYKNADMVRAETDILLIDLDMFEESESVQFFLSKIRKKIHNLPVILILKPSNRDNLDYEWFFNDFICYPLRKGELELRINKFVSQNKSEIDDNILKVGRITINLLEYSIYYDNEKLDFTYKEFELLRLLVQNSGQAFSRKDLLAKIWGVEYIGGTRTVDVHIRRLRSKLGDDFNSLIETVRNVGYRCIK
ncbi:MAG TPA: response regulator transcription factor [Spirochaetota bacterium]|nr:response regulator transcription factor [Spirochaetota bacterium]HOR45034.1 response regulator transcription factor [Spirochaetota bacterium]HPK56552.1 response regulator transcription factor [Spirochaetota bacterium]